MPAKPERLATEAARRQVQSPVSTGLSFEITPRFLIFELSHPTNLPVAGQRMLRFLVLATMAWIAHALDWPACAVVATASIAFLFHPSADRQAQCHG
jgi:hypothetical protein